MSKAASTLIVTVFLTLALFVPLSAVLLGSFGKTGFLTTLLDPVVLSTVKFTAVQAFISTLCAGILGYPLGLFLGATERRRTLPLAQRFLSLPFGIPTIVAATAWIILLGRNGFLNRIGLSNEILYSWKAIILVHVVFNVPYVALLVSQRRSAIPERLFQTLRCLGANRWQRFRELTWYFTAPTFATALIQVFSFCTMSFSLVLLLGGGPPVSTLETSIYERLRLGVLDLEGASACAIWQIALNLVPIVILRMRLRERVALDPGAAPSGQRFAWIAATLGFLWLIPYLFVFDGFANALRESKDVTDVFLPALGDSLNIAIATSVLTLSIATLSTIVLSHLRARPTIYILFESILSFSGGVSAMVIGVGIWLAYGAWIDPFSQNFLIIVTIQTLIFLPAILRILLPIIGIATERRRDLARSLGAKRIAVFKLVDWPHWRRPLLTAWSICFGMSFAEVATVSMFSGEELFPLPVLIMQLLGQYKFASAQVVSIGLAMICIAAIWLGSIFSTQKESSIESA